MRRGRAIPNRQRFDDARGLGTGEGIFFVSVPARVRRSVGSSSGVARVRTAAVGLGCETLSVVWRVEEGWPTTPTKGESDGWETILGFAMRERARRLTIGSVPTFVSDK